MPQLFHWKCEGLDVLVMDSSEDAASRAAIAMVRACSWQDTKRFERVIADLSLRPYFVAPAGYAISIDSRERA